APITDNVLVLVHALPDANAGPDDSITTGSFIQLVATGGVQYTWAPSSGLDNSGIYNPLAGPNATTTYTVTVIDVYECVNSDEMTLTVIIPSFWIPNAFTPDENTNNILYVRGEGINDFEFTVVNRWGQTVFYSKDMSQGWDGTQQLSGEPAPKGAYVYIIKGTKSNSEPVNMNGLVNLIR
ncbi:MAG: gliding motility-associated C-terminal domain-containing protein, partial [Bacteroidetes bacterium]|nr:gliding motility-associated C-terminal domain-containing protein [Bacteroidota bacterium]